MKISRILLIVFSMIASAANAENEKSEFADNESITILASTSLAVPIADISKLYSRESRVDVNAVYAASSELYDMVEEGDPADIIITPSLSVMNNLKKHGYVDASTKIILAGNNLAIVASKKMKFEYKETDIKNILDSLYNKTILVIGEADTTSLGFFTKAALDNLGLWQKISSRAQLAESAAKTADYIIKGESAGIIYYSDAMLYADDLDIIAKLPDSLHDPIEYYAAVVVGDNMAKARKYLEFLSSEKAKQVFKANNFVVK